ncbi:MAG TPA: TIGR03619 family F420-dependent LLM class oxidoreductase [Candidatus Binataceae bacterium]|jgi:probable F420-dependent oxidoreductase|nr:TIGR03619 family F420-dependent LLM class oxidoreductase [Candidatus Binataceae bacterium]
MKFGTFIAQVPGFDLASGVRTIEALGFESVWVGDHIALRDDHKAPYPYSPNQRYQLPANYPFSDPFVLLTYAAALTTRLRLATGVYLLPLRNPFTTAKAVATLDALSNGRFIFGVGMGWMSDEFELMGYDFKDRGARMVEYMALLTEVWSKPVAAFEGRTVKTEGFSFYPQPLQQPHPPFVLGGNTDPSLKRAARLGDGWFGIVTSIEQARDYLGRLAEFERQAGRERKLERTLLPTWNVSVEDVRRLAELGVERVIDAGWFGMRDPMGYLKQFADRLIQEFAE